MFGLGVLEIALILAIALVVLGPEQMPKVASQLGRAVRQARRVAAEFQADLEEAADIGETRRELAEALREPPLGTEARKTGESQAADAVSEPKSGGHSDDV